MIVLLVVSKLINNHMIDNQENKHKSFRLTFFKPTENKKWWQFRQVDTREYGYTALVLILLGVILKGALGDFLCFLGVMCGVVWIIRKAIKK